MYIKKKLLALSVVLAMGASFAACSDKDDTETADAKGNNSSAVDDETLSPSELDAITKHDLIIEPFTAGGDSVTQDAVEGDDSNNNTVAGDNSTAAGDSSVAAGDSSSQSSGDSSQSAGNSSQSAGDSSSVSNDSSSNSSSGSNNNSTAGNIGNNNADLPAETGLKVINGTKSIMQAWWMDISRGTDYVFNGEYLTAEFKIKDGVEDGIYPITIEWLDFSNWNSQTIEFTGIDGAIVVGGEATENTFNDDGTPQVMASNVSGKAGDTVTVSFHIQNNPGVVANIFRFGFNSDALEYVGGGEGADFNGHFS
ncbi:MAG: hypothetical protein ACI4JB_03840 [Porcipelethomonas sp.]